MPQPHRKGPMQRTLNGCTPQVAIRRLARFCRKLCGDAVRVCAGAYLLLVLLPPRLLAGEEAVIHLAVSRNVALQAPAKREMAAIFLGQKRQWGDGTRVKIALLASEGEQRRFLATVADRSPRQYWAHWRNIVFSGRGIMPKIFDSEEEVLNYVAAEKGAIGQVTDIQLAERKGSITLTIDGVTAR